MFLNIIDNIAEGMGLDTKDVIFFLAIIFVLILIGLWILADILLKKYKDNKPKKVNNIKEESDEAEMIEEETEDISTEPIKEDDSSDTLALESNLNSQEKVVAIPTEEETNNDLKEESEEIKEESLESTEEVIPENIEPESSEETAIENNEVTESIEVTEPTDINDSEIEQVESSELFESEEKSIEIVDELKEEEIESTSISEFTEISDPVIVEEKPKKKTTRKSNDTSKSRSYNGKYEVYQIGDGYQYQLKASNGEVLFVSEEYTSRDGVSKAIDALKKNVEVGTIKISKNKKGLYKFKLISKNYRVLAISSTYSQEVSAERASESFKKFALKADIVDVIYEDTDIKTASVIEITSNENKEGGKFRIEKYEGEYSWDLKASNGQILCQADGYTSKAGCTNSIENFKKNIETGTFKCVKDKAGQYSFKLYNEAGRVCAVGESYSTKTSAESAANSVVSFYKLAQTEMVDIK